MHGLQGNVLFLELQDCTVVSICTTDEVHEWVKLYENKRDAALEVCGQGLISSQEADALIEGKSQAPATWSRAIEIYPKATGRLGWMYFPGKVGTYH